MNAIFSSLGLGANVEGSRKFNVETAVDEKNEWEAIVSDVNLVKGLGVSKEETRPMVVR